MVLYKRKPVKILPNPVVEDGNQQVWVVSATGEIFTDYEGYLDRMKFFRQPVADRKQKKFICEITGHSGLDYFDALESERTGSKGVDEVFPEALKGPILRRVQLQTISRVDNLVDVVYDAFKDDFYPGEMIIATLPNHDRAEGVIREKVEFSEQKNAQGTIIKPASANYTVRLTNKDNEEIVLPNSSLMRDRKIFTKAMLRAFIKGTVQREPWNGAPWTVKDIFAKQYHIDQTIPKHLQRGATASERKAYLAYRKAQQEKGLALVDNPTEAVPILSKNTAAKSKGKAQPTKQKQSILNITNGHIKIQARPEPVKPPSPKPPPIQIKYPIEDLAIMPFKDGKTRPEIRTFSSVKSNVQEDNVPVLLETWEFLNVYCEPLLLDSFTFDDYVEALEFTSEDVDCELLVEIHCALLKSFVDGGENGKIKLTNLPVESDEEDVEDDEDGEDDEDEQNDDKMDIDSPGRRSGKGSSKSAAQTQPEHLASEMERDYSWVDRLRQRDFKHGGWQACLVGLLLNVSKMQQYSELANEILSHLAPPDMPPNQETARMQYAQLDINLRICLVQTLQRLTYDTHIVREYMEECNEGMTKMRKEKIEYQKARKVFIEELKSLEEDRKILLPENIPQSPEPESRTNNGTPTGDDENEDKGNNRGTSIEDEDDDSEPIGPSLRRGADRANERKRKREQEKEKADQVAKLPKSAVKFRKILQQIEKLKKQIKDEEDKIAVIDNDLREADCARLRLVGRDRFWNKYWFLERNGMPYGGLPTSSTADAGFAMGRLWLQGPSKEEHEGFLDVDAIIKNETNAEGKIAISIKERKKREEGKCSLNGPNRWGYIDTTEGFEELLEWLDPKGEREFKLKKELEIYKEKILNAMIARRKYLTPSSDRREGDTGTRMSTRTKVYVDTKVFKCLRWTNTIAVERLGHIHVDQPKAKKTKTRTSAGSTGGFQAINKDGRALGRQGTRYTF